MNVKELNASIEAKVFGDYDVMDMSRVIIKGDKQSNFQSISLPNVWLKNKVFIKTYFGIEDIGDLKELILYINAAKYAIYYTDKNIKTTKETLRYVETDKSKNVTATKGTPYSLHGNILVASVDERIKFNGVVNVLDITEAEAEATSDFLNLKFTK